ncbi:disulfide bond formation protein DsbA [halophilic archaeon]|nr:disulfide bond formation protein DsbA [halophilic archaeon]
MSQTTPLASTPKLMVPVNERDHIQGSPDAPVTLVEYGDYECPHCGRAYFIIQEIQRVFGYRLRFVFRNFPLTTVHPHAQHAAEAAEAAGAQGKFWEMHDALYENQDALGDDHLRKYATELGLDVERFSREVFVDHTYADHVHEDFMSGVRSGVNGTPTFFINNRRHDGSWDKETLLVALKEAAESSQ